MQVIHSVWFKYHYHGRTVSSMYAQLQLNSQDDQSPETIRAICLLALLMHNRGNTAASSRLVKAAEAMAGGSTELIVDVAITRCTIQHERALRDRNWKQGMISWEPESQSKMHLQLNCLVRSGRRHWLLVGTHLCRVYIRACSSTAAVVAIQMPLPWRIRC